jgi:hypothetical protein
MPSAAITPDAVLPLLLAAADSEFVPAQLWPLDAALVALDRVVPDGSPVARALRRMPQSSVSTGQRFTGLRGSIHRLVSSGALVPGGEGWDAGYAVSAELLYRGRSLLTTLTPPEHTALRRAAQTLNDSLRMLSKKSAASLPSGSPRI